MSLRRKILGSVFFLLAMAGGQEKLFAEKIRIVATTSTFADITRSITGELADIYFVASPKQDIHFISPTPKDVLKVKKADVLVHGGLDLEVWRDPLLVAVGNGKLIGDSKVSIDVSRGIPLLEIPDTVSRSQGDIHLFGNPHYWMDPDNAKKIAGTISQRLSEIYPELASQFQQNLEEFIRKSDENMKLWHARLMPFKGARIVTYHKNWVYFAQFFGFEIVGQIEPKPGIPPTAKHITLITEIIKQQNVRMIVRESYQEDRSPKKLAKNSSAKVVTLTQSVGEFKGTDDYFSMMNYNVELIANALENSGAQP